MRPKLYLIHLKNRPILGQLQIEEALLRTEDRNFLLINEGSSKAIVMGISGTPENLINIKSAAEEKIPIIKRFSGGGTVIVDESTLFISFIMNKNALNVTPYPEPILKWSSELYKSAWNIPEFELKENDYCIGEKKCGGNAQYIKKDRWVHHTSFLWDYSEKNMSHLLLPSKRPKYREDRDHKDFLIRMNKFGSAQEYIEKLKNYLKENVFDLNEFDLTHFEPSPHRMATEIIN